MEIKITLPNIQDILNGKPQDIPKMDLSIQYAVMAALGYELNTIAKSATNTIDQMAATAVPLNNVLIFACQHIDKEICLLFLRTLIELFGIVIYTPKLPAWGDFFLHVDSDALKN